MADTKITSLLTPQVTTNPATDVLPIVNIADTSMATSGSTRKITVNQLLGAGGTATLASATITGNLTVDTNTLFVDSANNRVGVLTASPAQALDVASGNLQVRTGGTVFSDTFSNYGAALQINAAGSLPLRLQIGGSNAYEITSANVHTWQNVGGVAGTAMTLNSTGLGIGVTPSAWPAASKAIDVDSYGANYAIAAATQVGISRNCYYNGTNWIYKLTTSAQRFEQDNGGGFKWFTAAAGTAGTAITFTQAMTMTAAGELLTGTTTALASGNTFQNLGTSRQVLSLKGDAFGSYTLGVWNASTINDGLFQYFATETTLTVRGGISYNRGGGLVAYNTTSDYRAKDIIGPVSNSGSLIDSLKVYVGKMKGATIERPMLIAHEAQEVAPYAVTGTKDEVDADGNPKYQQMDVSALVPVLIAEIQSLRARVQTLETR